VCLHRCVLTADVCVLQAEELCAHRALGTGAEGGSPERHLPADRNGTRVWRKDGVAQLSAVHWPDTVVKTAGK
jgi:hypothetical protein